jgi:hypothetical protein
MTHLFRHISNAGSAFGTISGPRDLFDLLATPVAAREVAVGAGEVTFAKLCDEPLAASSLSDDDFLPFSFAMLPDSASRPASEAKKQLICKVWHGDCDCAKSRITFPRQTAANPGLTKTVR